MKKVLIISKIFVNFYKRFNNVLYLCINNLIMQEKFLEVKQRFEKEFDDIIIEDTVIILEEYFDDGGACKNDDDCYDQALENAHRVMEIFPELEIVSYYCHRHKYAICELKINTLIYDIN